VQYVREDSSEDKPSPPPSMARLILDKPVATKLHPTSSPTIFLSPCSMLPQLASQLVRLLLATALHLKKKKRRRRPRQLAGALMPNCRRLSLDPIRMSDQSSPASLTLGQMMLGEHYNSDATFG